MKASSLKTALLSAAGLGLIAACTPQFGFFGSKSAEPELAAAAAPEAKFEGMRTTKFGAPVTFSHEFREKPALGDFVTVDITVSENVMTGVLSLEAYSDDGLTVFGPTSTAQFSMADGDAHVWPVAFDVDAEGRHYLNVAAVTEIPGQPALSRSYSVRVDIGDIQKKTRAVTLESGETAVLFEAEETITTGE